MSNVASDATIVRYSDGVNFVDFQTAQTVAINTTGTTTTLVTGVTGQKIYVTGYTLVVGAATNVNLQDDLATILLGQQNFVANSGISISGHMDSPVVITAAGRGLVIKQSGTAQLGGSIAFFQH